MTLFNGVLWVFLVCEKCGGYYKLQKGESPDDFEECQCGGRLKYCKHISSYIGTEPTLDESKNHEKSLGHDKKSNHLRNMAREVYGTDFRENQKHFFKFFREHKHENIIADAPTGGGKSLIAMQIAINLELPGTVFIVTPTKDLMKQYERDFVKTGGCIIGSSLHEGVDFPGKQLEVVVVGRAPFVPFNEDDKYYPNTERRITNKIRKTWEGLRKRGVQGIEPEEYRLRTLQQIGRLQRKETDTGIIILCNSWAIDEDIKKDFELCPGL